MVNESANYSTARSDCEEKGATLATISDDNENDFLHGLKCFKIKFHEHSYKLLSSSVSTKWKDTLSLQNYLIRFEQFHSLAMWISKWYKQFFLSIASKFLFTSNISAAYSLPFSRILTPWAILPELYLPLLKEEVGTGGDRHWSIADPLILEYVVLKCQYPWERQAVSCWNIGSK